jgi:hypothetical protein
VSEASALLHSGLLLSVCDTEVVPAVEVRMRTVDGWKSGGMNEKCRLRFLWAMLLYTTRFVPQWPGVGAKVDSSGVAQFAKWQSAEGEERRAVGGESGGGQGTVVMHA